METPPTLPTRYLLVDISVLVTSVSVTSSPTLPATRPTRTSSSPALPTLHTSPALVECIRHDATAFLATLSHHYLLYVYGSLHRFEMDRQLRRIDAANVYRLGIIYSEDVWQQLPWIRPEMAVNVTQAGSRSASTNPGSCILLPAVGERELGTSDPVVLGPATDYLLALSKDDPPSTVEYLSRHPLVIPDSV
jgi:hypothetical protein